MQTTDNNLFPVFLKLEKFRVLIVGGGKVALEKVTAILRNSPATSIRLVGISVSAEIEKLSWLNSNLSIHRRQFDVEDLNNTDFVIVAVNDKTTSQNILSEAHKRKIITNVADTPEQCDFYLGSIVQKGNVKIAISTNGKSPTVAKRIKETLDENLPAEIDGLAVNLSKLRGHLKGDFSEKVKKLNKITSGLSIAESEKHKRKKLRLLLWVSLVLLIGSAVAYFIYNPNNAIAGAVDFSKWKFALVGFVAEVINGALGMAYGLTTTTMLMSAGIAPQLTLIIVHILEVFTAGSSGFFHYKLGNVNKKLLYALALPGVIGAALGAFVLYSFKQHSAAIKEVVAVYTLILGVVIIIRTVNKHLIKRKVKKIFPLGFIAGLLDAIGGGGWGIITSSTLIAGGRNPRYVIGSVILSRCFVAIASSITLIALVGFAQWSIIGWLVAGGIIGSPIGPYMAKHIPVKITMIIVAIAIVVLSTKQLFF